MEEALVGYLLAIGSPVVSQVGTRAHWGMSPQGTDVPRITLLRIDGAPVYSDEGAAGLVESRVQIDCWAETYTDAKAVSRAVQQRLLITAVTTGGVEFQSITLDAERDFVEGDPADKDRLHRVSLDYLIWHTG